MKFSRLFKESRLFWPSEIIISDGELRKGGGGFFPTLNRVWDEVEEVQSKINEWHNIMSWAMFCGFHKAACQRLQDGDLSPVKYSEIDRRYIESKMSENLKVVYPSYPKYMRSQYVNDVAQ